MSDNADIGDVKQERVFFTWIMVAVVLALIAMAVESFANGGPELILGINVKHVIGMAGWAALLTALLAWWRPLHD